MHQLLENVEQAAKKDLKKDLSNFQNGEKSLEIEEGGQGRGQGELSGSEQRGAAIYEVASEEQKRFLLLEFARRGMCRRAVIFARNQASAKKLVRLPHLHTLLLLLLCSPLEFAPVLLLRICIRS
jgi:hypothetical protein